MEQITAKNINLVTVGEKNSHPKNIHPFIIRSWPHLAPLRIYQEHRVSRSGSTSLSPLEIHFAREIAGVNGHTRAHAHAGRGKRNSRNPVVVFVVPENPPLSSKVGCRFFRCRNGGPHVPTSWNETRKRWEVGGVARSCLGSLLSGESSAFAATVDSRL